jgi:hypothetical protein
MEMDEKSMAKVKILGLDGRTKHVHAKKSKKEWMARGMVRYMV